MLGKKSSVNIRIRIYKYIYIYIRIHTCNRININKTIEAQNKNGPKKVKSLPLLAAQNVYKVRLTVIRTVSPAAIKIVSPVNK